MAVDSTVLGSAGLAADVFGIGLRGFFAALPVLRLAPAVLVTFFQATFFGPLAFRPLSGRQRPLFSCGLMRSHDTS